MRVKCLAQQHNTVALVSGLEPGSLTLDPVVQRMDNVIHRINHYPVENC